MQTTKSARNIRLKDLQEYYFMRLQRGVYDVYDLQLHNGVIKPGELDADISAYYQKTLPSLQEFYSHYVSQWEYFYDIQDASDAKFSKFLSNSLYAFSIKYNKVDLNASYYIQQFQNLKPRTKKWVELRAHFMNSWHKALTNNEYNYQMEHIEALCDAFIRLQRQRAGNLPVTDGRSRLRWLTRDDPQLCQEILDYDKRAKETPAIQELVRLLGERQHERNKHFMQTVGIRKERLVRTAGQSDIVGIREGDELSCLLPIEYAYLADSQLEPFFLERYTQKRLQVMDYISHQRQTVIEMQEKENKTEGQGPFIVCIDTSASMVGEPERLAKSALLAIAELTEVQDRKCYVILFSVGIECLEIDSLGTGFRELTRFLSNSFQGGTDMTSAITQAVNIIQAEGYERADLLLVSDFDMPPLPEYIDRKVRLIKEKETKVYALAMGGNAVAPDFCDKIWSL